MSPPQEAHAPPAAAGSGQEVELKLLLPDGLALDLVRSALESTCGCPADLAEQVNYYLDTPMRDLRRQRVMIRVRTAGTRVRATCKSNPTLVAGVMRVGEEEHALQGVLAERWLKSAPHRCTWADLAAQPWHAAGGPLFGTGTEAAQLYVVGAMATTRRTWTLQEGDIPGLPAGLTLELDHARFGEAGSDGHRFELEVEHPQAADLADAIYAWLLTLGVYAWPAEESKYAQMLRHLDAG